MDLRLAESPDMEPGGYEGLTLPPWDTYRYTLWYLITQVKHLKKSSGENGKFSHTHIFCSRNSNVIFFYNNIQAVNSAFKNSLWAD